MMRLALTILLYAGLLQPLAAQVDATELCKPSRAGVGPNIVFSAELGAGANGSRSDRRPWRLTGRLMPTYLVDRVRGIGIGAIAGGTTSQPAGAIVGARASVRLMNLLKLGGFNPPGAEVQGAVEYGYIVGGDQAHSVAGTLGLELLDLARITLRANRIFPYTSSSGRVLGQWVFELGLGRTFSLHSPKVAPPPRPPAELLEAYTLGQSVAQSATLIPSRLAEEGVPAEPARCDLAAIHRLSLFSTVDAPRVHTRVDLIAALRRRQLDRQAGRIDKFFPAGPEPESRQVDGIIAGIQFVFPP